MATSSPRRLVLRNLAKTVQRDTTPSQQADDEVKLPDPGYMQIYSYYKPALVAGNYTITVSQRIRLPNDPVEKTLGNPDAPVQTFQVVAPQFKIDTADIHSTYPPQGHADQPNVLPHIVFSDPHLPWERIALLPPPPEAASTPNPAVALTGGTSTASGTKPPATGLKKTASTNDFDILPWLAIFPFDCNGPANELRLASNQLKALQDDGAVSVPPNPQAPTQPLVLKQSATFTVPMTLKEYLALPTTSKTSTVVIPPILPADVQDDLSLPVDVVFLSQTLFKNLFANQAGDAVDISQYRYTAHVRIVNTAGMASAGVANEHGLFSVVHSRRTGPTDIAQNTAPRSQAVHLISIEHVALMTGIGTMSSNTLVAFVSLQSWTYLCQPPMTVNFVDCECDPCIFAESRSTSGSVVGRGEGERASCPSCSSPEAPLDGLLT